MSFLLIIFCSTFLSLAFFLKLVSLKSHFLNWRLKDVFLSILASDVTKQRKVDLSGL